MAIDFGRVGPELKSLLSEALTSVESGLSAVADAGQIQGIGSIADTFTSIAETTLQDPVLFRPMSEAGAIPGPADFYNSTGAQVDMPISDLADKVDLLKSLNDASLPITRALSDFAGRLSGSESRLKQAFAEAIQPGFVAEERVIINPECHPGAFVQNEAENETGIINPDCHPATFVQNENPSAVKDGESIIDPEQYVGKMDQPSAVKDGESIIDPDHYVGKLDRSAGEFLTLDEVIAGLKDGNQRELSSNLLLQQIDKLQKFESVLQDQVKLYSSAENSLFKNRLS